MLMSVWPTTTAIRKTGSQRLGRRIISTTNTPTVDPDDARSVPPNDVTKSSIHCANDVMCSSPHGATERSMRSRLGVGAHEEAEHAEDHPADDEHDERERQEQPGLGLRV